MDTGQSTQSDDQFCYLINTLPAEMLENIIFKLDIETMCNLSCTCILLFKKIHHNERLWRYLCKKHCNANHIQENRQSGCTWKATFIENYGRNAVKKQWKAGALSKIQTYDDLPCKPICPMDVETWGELFQMELNR
ncbi:unnamed protein product [Owenia fusiformis]|uniref:F-box domain-containing protein n=1 Tax=Owenia fusiformis TaxID=6347 RepID=A0A8S4PGL8_OWEFU|nr:unnamed protein product [Owenia fusiformis]